MRPAREVKSSGRVCSVAVRLLLAEGKPQLLLHISKYDPTSMSNIPSEDGQIIVALACSVAVLSMPLPSPERRAMIGRGLGYGQHGRSCCSHKVWQRKSADDANKKAQQQWCSSLTTMCDFSAESWMLCIVANVPPLVLTCSVAWPPHGLRIIARMHKRSQSHLPAT